MTGIELKYQISQNQIRVTHNTEVIFISMLSSALYQDGKHMHQQYGEIAYHILYLSNIRIYAHLHFKHITYHMRT